MEQKNKGKMIWIGLLIAIFLGLMAISLWYVPYDISHDQHMVDTINVRALEYEHPDGVVTDFTEAEIMQQDAIETYEGMEWKLDNPELYWYHGIFRGVLLGSMGVLGLYALIGMIELLISVNRAW
ncbi:hypothetical protein KAU43_04245 [candidate division WOR-3 bacterium]|nr:hypothetical protein [candidate division WOR-3 bacterium]